MTQELTRRIRCTAAASLGALAASALLFAPQAAADPGDVTHVHTSNNVEVSTDACRGAFLQVTMEGAPAVPDTYTIAFGGTNCQTRARFVGVRDDGRTPFDTGYIETDRNDGLMAFGEVYRCHVEFGVRRANGSYLTKLVRPVKAEVQNCP
jgi:hypothetical protein